MTSAHPWRVVIVGGALALVASLLLVLGRFSDTSSRGRQAVSSDIAQVNPSPGDIVGPLAPIEVHLRSGLTGVIVVDGQRLPEDQAPVDNSAGTITFRPGPGKDIPRFGAGVHTVAVLYWKQTEPEPPKPKSFGWSFRAAA